MRHLLVLILLVILHGRAARAQDPPPNIRIHPGAVTQTEPVIAVSPTDPLLLFSSARTINTTSGFSSEGVYVSTDGGTVWSGSDTCAGQLLANHGGDPGVMVAPGGRFVLTHIGSVFPGVYSHNSNDRGATWSAAVTITSQQPEDKGAVTQDNDPASPYYGRMYTSWVNFVSPFPVLVSFSTDSAGTWSTPAAINAPPPRRSSGGSIATGPGGRLVVVWSGMTANAPFQEDFAGCATSSDGGGTWTVSQNIFDMNGINGTLSAKGNIRVNGLPQVAIDRSSGPRSGWIYVVTTEKNLSPAGGDPDVILHRSTDGGTTWSAGIRVNQDPVDNGRIQYFPAMDIDPEGGINIIFCDDRNTSADSAEILLARSIDGGDTWSEQVVSNHRFKPKPIIGGSSNYQGDHLALLAVGRKLYALWMDDSSGLYQVWLAVVTPPSDAGEQEGGRLPSRFALIQNYPNPFNPATTVTYHVPRTRHITLTAYSILGEEIAVLVDEMKPPGVHHVSFPPAGMTLTTGVYVVRMATEEGSWTRKVLMVK